MTLLTDEPLALPRVEEGCKQLVTSRASQASGSTTHSGKLNKSGMVKKKDACDKKRRPTPAQGAPHLQARRDVAAIEEEFREAQVDVAAALWHLARALDADDNEEAVGGEDARGVVRDEGPVAEAHVAEVFGDQDGLGEQKLATAEVDLAAARVGDVLAVPEAIIAGKVAERIDCYAVVPAEEDALLEGVG